MFSVFFCAEAFGGKHFHARLPWCSFSDGDFYGIKSSWASRRVQKMQQERVQQKKQMHFLQDGKLEMNMSDGMEI